MPTDRLDQPLTGGQDRSIVPLRANKSTFYSLFNFRQASSQGLLEQTPNFTQLRQITAGTYYNAGSQTEAATSWVRMLATNTSVNSSSATLEVTDFCIFGGGSQKQVYYQTTVPAAVTINTHCLLVPTTASFGTTLGNSYDVEIDGATTFKWRKNGGAYTTLVTISTVGNSIDGGAATVYWLVNSGFTVGHVWSWTRTDSSRDDFTNTPIDRQLPHVHYRGKTYFLNRDGRVMVHDTASALTSFVRSVGYRPIYGAFLTVFEDHLIIGQYRTTALSSTTGADAVVLAWSDLNDLDNFWATDVNEADQFTVPTTSSFSNVRNVIIGLSVLQSLLYVYCSNEIYYTSYLGLPTVFDFNNIKDVDFGTRESSSVQIINAVDKDYILTARTWFQFDGTQLKNIGLPISSTLVNPEWGVYVPERREVVAIGTSVITNGQLLCFQEDYNTFYTRAVSFESWGVSCLGVSISDRKFLILGTRSRKIHTDYGSTTAQPVYDGNGSTDYAVPHVTTQLFGNNLSTVKEIETVYFGGYTGSWSSTHYYTTTAVTVHVKWYLSTDGTLDNNPTLNSDSNATWTSAASNGLVSIPRSPFRSIAIRLEIRGTDTTKPAGPVYLTAIEPNIIDSVSLPYGKL